MTDAIEFDPNLYRGTAAVYDRFRVPYPHELIEDMMRLTRPSGHGRLLDLACGTGQVTFAVAEHFAEVWAVDREPDMIDVVRDKASSLASEHVQTVVSAAETLHAPTGGFEVVAIGNAFHRLRREQVAANSFRWLQPGGYLALVWGSGPWTGETDWQRTLSEVLASWRTKTGAHTRVPVGWDEPRRKRPDAAVLTAAGFDLLGSRRFPTTHAWTIDALIGYVYSTSFLPKPILGAQAHEFEADLRRSLADLTSTDPLTETVDFAYELACRPT